MNANLDILAQSLEKTLEGDSSVVVLGEDVAHGGNYGLTLPASQRPELAKRLLATPLTTTSLLAHAGGLALGGKQPIVLLGGVSDLLDGLAGLREMGRYNWSGGDTRACPMVVLVPVGPGMDEHDDASESPEQILASIPGIRVLTLGESREVPALFPTALQEAQSSESPVVVLIPRSLLLAPAVEHPDASPFSTISVHKVGSRATVYCWGGCVPATLLACEELEDVSVVEVHQLAPLDHDALVAHAERSGRILVVHAGRPENSISAQLAATLADEAILHLDAPVRRLSGPSDWLLPHDDAAAAPSVAAIAQAIEETIHY